MRDSLSSLREKRRAFIRRARFAGLMAALKSRTTRHELQLLNRILLLRPSTCREADVLRGELLNIIILGGCASARIALEKKSGVVS